MTYLMFRNIESWKSNIPFQVVTLLPHQSCEFLPTTTSNDGLYSDAE
jgi:hypothetical protein